MEAIAIVTGLAVLQSFWFAFEVGKARVANSIAAPTTTGIPEFERTFRIFGFYIHAYAAAAIGVVYLIARMMYRSGYLRDPAARSKGFGLTALSMVVLVLGGMGGAIWSMIQS
jgi:hypothetical protein